MIRKKTLLSSSLLCGIVLLAGCKQIKDTQESLAYLIRGDTALLSGHDWYKHIRISEARQVSYTKEIVTAGIVRPIPTQYAYIASPFAGRVVKSYVHMGQKVDEGTPLFEIICPAFTAAQKEYFQSLSTRDFARKNLLRKEDLIRNGVSSQKELEEAQNTLSMAEKEFENAQAALRVYQVENLASLSLGQPLVVRTPISGVVIKDNIVSGQYLKEDSEPVAAVADLSKIWVSAQVKEKDIRFIKVGNSLAIEIAALPETHIKGLVYYIEEIVDEDTRSIRVLSECENPGGILKSGMYTTVHFRSDPQERVEIPETALLQGENGNFVYVQITANSFVRRNVTVEATSEGNAITGKELQAGERVISEGGYYLK